MQKMMLFSLALVVSTIGVASAQGKRARDVERRADRANRKSDRLDRKSDRLDRRADRARDRGKDRKADRLDRRADRADRKSDRLDRKSDRLDRKADRLDSRADHKGHGHGTGIGVHGKMTGGVPKPMTIRERRRANRAQRRRVQRRRLRAQANMWAQYKGEARKPVRAAFTKHAKRMAKLERMEELALSLKRPKLLKRIQVLKAKEVQRHNKWVITMRKK